MFVLIHGGGHSSRCWEPLVPLLDAPALALDLPGRGVHPGPLDEIHLSDWVDSAVDDIERADVTDAVLVGHSMAGLSIPAIMDRVHARFRHVVFASCAIPPDGGSLLDLLPPEITAFVDAAPRSPEGVSLSADEVVAMQCYDMDAQQTAFTLQVVVPEAYWPVRDTVHLDGMRHPVPRTWMKLTRDHTFVPALQDEMAARAGCAEVVEIDSGHVAMISHPAQLAAALNAVHAKS
jgi:pimeloyl-ACP methyl ester carboxylesterase